MESCDRNQDVLLDMLYGLLDEAETLRLRNHLAECASCQAAQEAAEEQRRLLAKAALAVTQAPEFTAPAFAAPAAEEIASSLRDTVAVAGETTLADPPATIPLAAPRQRRLLRRGLAWAVAASIAIAAGLAWTIHAGQVAEQRAEVADIRRKVETVDARLAALPGSLQAEAKAARILAERSRVHLQVLGPTRIAPGTPGNLQILVHDLEGKKRKARTEVRLVDAVEGEELERSTAEVDGEKVLTLNSGGMKGPVRLSVRAETDGAVAAIEETLHLQAPEFRTHLTLNKGIYRVGEVLFFRTLTLERFTHRPPQKEIPLRFELLDGVGRAVKELVGRSGAGGIAAGTFALTDDLVPGTYSLRVRPADPKGVLTTEQAKTLKILRDDGIRLEFDRTQYSPGDAVNLGVRLQQNRQRRDRDKNELSVRILVDGKALVPQDPAAGKKKATADFYLQPDGEGNAVLRFQLPKRIEQGQAQVEVYRRPADGKPLVQDIPVIPSRLAVDFFPEGGDLVAGVVNKVYYRVRTPQGESFDPQGHVIVLSSKDVLFDSLRGQGVGYFFFVPDGKENYSVRITNDSGRTDIDRPFADLKLRTDGIALHVPEPVVASGRPLEVVLRNPGPPRPLLLTAQCRGRLIDQRFLAASEKETRITLRPAEEVQGVVRLTLFDAELPRLRPLAERLVFRGVDRKLDLGLTIREGNGPYPPGQALNFTIRTPDENGNPVQAWLLASVVEERFAASGADIGLLEHFFLTDAVEPGEEIERLPGLNVAEPVTRRNLDLFLGTRGWRRFRFEDRIGTAVVKSAQESSSLKADGIELFSAENAGISVLRAEVRLEMQKKLDRLRDEAAARQEEMVRDRDRLALQASYAWSVLQDLEARPGLVLRAGLGFATLFSFVGGILLLGWGTYQAARRHPARVAFTGSFASLAVCTTFFLVARYGMGPLADPANPPGWARHKEIGALASNDRPGEAWQPFVPTGPVGRLAAAFPQEKAKSSKTDPVRVRLNASQLHIAENQERRRQDAEGSAGLFPGGPDLAREQGMNEEMQKRFMFAQKAQDLMQLQNRMHGGTGQGGFPAPTLPPPAAGFGKGKVPPGVLGPAPGGLGGAGSGPPFVQELVREYAHRYRGRRLEVQDTLLWHPALPAPNGQAEVGFELSGTTGNYRLLILGNSLDGRLGHLETNLSVEKVTGK